MFHVKHPWIPLAVGKLGGAKLPIDQDVMLGGMLWFDDKCFT